MASPVYRLRLKVGKRSPPRLSAVGWEGRGVPPRAEAFSAHHKVRYTTTLPATPWPLEASRALRRTGRAPSLCSTRGLEEAQGDHDGCSRNSLTRGECYARLSTHRRGDRPGGRSADLCGLSPHERHRLRAQLL